LTTQTHLGFARLAEADPSTKHEAILHADQALNMASEAGYRYLEAEACLILARCASAKDRESYFHTAQELIVTRQFVPLLAELRQLTASHFLANDRKAGTTRLADYYAAQWTKYQPKWRVGDIACVAMQDDAPVPCEYCVTTVARLAQQSRSPLDKIMQFIEQLQYIDGRQFYYPADSLHMTLLGCTPRLTKREAFTEKRLEPIREVCERLCAGMGKVRVTLRGVGIQGAQVFLQGFPHDHRWAVMREQLTIALEVLGEKPISYEYRWPIYLNIARITAPLTPADDLFLQQIAEKRNFKFGEVIIEVVELLITDFVLSDRHTLKVTTLHL
jgi:hypothetical protein